MRADADMGDARGGVGNSMTDVCAVNVDTMERLCGVAANQKVDLVLSRVLADDLRDSL